MPTTHDSTHKALCEQLVSHPKMKIEKIMYLYKHFFLSICGHNYKMSLKYLRIDIKNRASRKNAVDKHITVSFYVYFHYANKLSHSKLFKFWRDLFHLCFLLFLDKGHPFHSSKKSNSSCLLARMLNIIQYFPRSTWFWCFKLSDFIRLLV